jgi:hypothetical protein
MSYNCIIVDLGSSHSRNEGIFLLVTYRINLANQGKEDEKRALIGRLSSLDCLPWCLFISNLIMFAA